MAKLWGQNKGATVTGQSIYSESLTATCSLGTRLQLGNRIFHYAKAGASALVAGKLCESAAFGGSLSVIELGLTVPATCPANGNIVYATANATDAVTKDQFAGGYLYVDSGSAAQGVGQTYKIKGNTAAVAGALITITVDDNLVIAISTSATVGIIANLYKNILTQATTPVGVPVGVPLIAVTATYYCWLQTWGPCCTLYSGAAGLNKQVIEGPAHAGSVAPQLAGSNSAIAPQIGMSLDTVADHKYGLINLQIAY